MIGRPRQFVPELFLTWTLPTIFLLILDFVSSRFYGALLGMVCMLYLLPLCWVLALLNSTLFLGNVEFFRGKAQRA